jgi:predicted nucleotidyltransferase
VTVRLPPFPPRPATYDIGMPLDHAVDREALVALCRRLHIARLELFGSRTRGTSRPDSDVDLLVTFEPGFVPGLEFFGMADEFAALLGHRVDLLTRAAVEQDRNPYFRRNVLANAEVLYAA